MSLAFVKSVNLAFLALTLAPLLTSSKPLDARTGVELALDDVLAKAPLPSTEHVLVREHLKVGEELAINATTENTKVENNDNKLSEGKGI